MSDDVTQDFIFGTLATDDLRLASLRAEGRGLYHGNRISPADPEPGQPVHVRVDAGTDVAATAVSLFYTLDGESPTTTSPRIDLTAGASVWDTLLWGYRREWHGALPAQAEGTLVRYQIAATTLDGETVWADVDQETGEAASFAYHVDRERVPVWLREAVIYHVFVDRFSPGSGHAWNTATSLNEIWGGTIRGVTEALPYLDELGVTCLWLSPVFPSPTHHGYDPTDYFGVEPRLGTVEDLREFFAAAHARGMRVLLDFVANHVSDEHPAFRRAMTDPVATERDWFTFIEWPRGYRSFFGVSSMPRLAIDHAGAADYVIEAARFWLEQGADGFRLDYANGPSHGFWSRFRAATRAAKPDSATFGEVVETAELQRSYLGRLDGTLDFLLLQQLRSFFAFDAIPASTFDAFLAWHLDYFPADFVLPSFLDNHDMNRFLWVAGGDRRRLKLAALCQFTLPHPPIIYYGTEVGLSQRRDLTYPDGSRRLEESRTLMPWGAAQDGDLLAYYRTLVAMRRARPTLWQGERTTLAADRDYLLAGLTDGRSRGLIAINRSSSPYRFDVPVGLSLAIATESRDVGADGSMTLSAMSGAVLVS
ncbi:MAG: cyclomaltodextrinase / maltogenic alpha-amylase / neopullulanase [Thermomicrobiales bacterium]|jgi:glycosidase|nr:cyclomaltodextrinase / maltogenic alpha-amylase / neopullulanase [Thermomicrobiales bacterium]